MHKWGLSPFSRAGYTLVEILVATTLSLLLLGAVVQMFGRVAESITNSRAMLESADRLRLAAARLQQDLAGITVTVDPPRRPEDNEGYFEYIEGPVTAATASGVAENTTDGATAVPDTTVGDFDDILMFTTRSSGRPFVGKLPVGINPSGTIQSDVAEVAWFLRGRTLHRRVLLVTPSVSYPITVTSSSPGFYANNDVSVHVEGSRLVPNTLGDLTRRECRFAHCKGTSDVFPFDARDWGQLGLPTLRECSASWPLASPPFTSVPPSKPTIDFWANATSPPQANDVPVTWADNVLGSGTRIADDVILTNVIGFDVKAWDPLSGSTGAYMDLGYGNMAYNPNWDDPNSPIPTPFRYSLTHLGHPDSLLHANANGARVYDTWSTSYDGDEASNGFDDGGGIDGIVDDVLEAASRPPYPVPLRGIQVKIRVFEPDSRQIREVTVIQDFLAQ